jgi:hypothetical protein
VRPSETLPKRECPHMLLRWEPAIDAGFFVP